MKLPIWPQNGAAESADDSPPSLPVKGHVAESGGGLHVRHAGSAAAPRAYSGCRLVLPHLSCLINKEAEANHYYFCLSFFFLWNFDLRKGFSLVFCFGCVVVWSLWFSREMWRVFIGATGWLYVDFLYYLIWIFVIIKLSIIYNAIVFWFNI